MINFIEEINNRFNLQPLTKPANCVIIEIDGLDACGKETFSKSLQFELEKVTSNAFSYTEIKRISFPDYDGNEYAGEIYKELRREKPLYNREQLDGLYFLDRYHTMKKVYMSCTDMQKTYVFILDRYMLSNCIYTHLPFMNQYEKVLNKATKLAYETLRFEVNMICGIDYLAVIYVPKDKTEFHHGLIKAKRNRNESDNNETFEKQDFLAEILRERIIFNTSRFTQKLLYPYISSNNTNVFRIPIGSTFNGNIEWEHKIIDQLLPRFKTREEITYYESGIIDEFMINLKYRPVVRLLDNIELVDRKSEEDINLIENVYNDLFSHYYDGEVLYLKDMMPKVIPMVAFLFKPIKLVENPKENILPGEPEEHKEYVSTNVRLDLTEYKEMIKYDSKFSNELIGKEFETNYYPIDGYHVRFHKSKTDDYLTVKFKYKPGETIELKPGLITIGYVLLERVEN